MAEDGTMRRVTRTLGRVVNRVLEPVGLEVRRRLSAGPRRRTMVAALERLKALGFQPATVFDVGVATGTPALYEVFPLSHHILIEPLVEFRPDLERIVARLRHAEYVLAAAGAHAGKALLNLGPNLHLASSREFRNRAFAANQQRIVPAIALDEIWETRGLHGPALVKIDVNGEELEVLRGAQAVLRSSDYVILEVGIREVLGGAPPLEAVLRYMTERGFLLDDILEPAYAADGFLKMADCAFARAGSPIRGVSEP